MLVSKKEFVEKVEKFDETIQIDIYHQLRNHTNNFTQNNNGVFFDLSDINLLVLQEILDKVNICVPKVEIKEEMKEIESEKIKKPVIKPPINDVDKLCVELESDKSKLNKRNIHTKYSVAKKKYNKQNNSDVKKIEENIHLNELHKEDYISK